MPPTIITASNGNAFLASTIVRVLSFDGTYGPLTAVHFADGGSPEIIGAETMLDAKRERDRIISEWHAATAKIGDEINGTSDDERAEFQSLAAYMLRSVGYDGAPLRGTQSAMRAIFDGCLRDCEAQNADALTVAVSRLTTEIDRGDKAREAPGSALDQLRDLSTHAQLLLDLATEAVDIDPGTGEIVSTPRGTVERVKAAMTAMVELRKMVW